LLKKPSGATGGKQPVSAHVSAQKRHGARQSFEDAIGKIFVSTGHDEEIHGAVPLGETLMLNILLGVN
jgi:hypothetical protein